MNNFKAWAADLLDTNATVENLAEALENAWQDGYDEGWQKGYDAGQEPSDHDYFT